MSDNGATYYTVLDEHAQQWVDTINEQLWASNERLVRLEEDNLRFRRQSANLTSLGQRFTPIRPVRLFGSGTDYPTTGGRPASSGDQNADGQNRDCSDFESSQAYTESIIEKRLSAFESMIERMPGVAPPIRRSDRYSYANSPFTDEIALVEMPKKFTFPSMKMYDGSTDSDNLVTIYRQP
ncbi:unnamed protein product [Cochlearia groenlandica]